MTRLAKTDDFNIEIRGAIYLNTIECGIAIPDFDSISIVILYDAIRLHFGDDIRIDIEFEDLTKLLVKISVEGCIYKAIELMQRLVFEMTMSRDPSLHPVKTHLNELREIYAQLNHAKRRIEQEYGDPDRDPPKHICYWELERDREPGTLTSIEQWHKECLDNYQFVDLDMDFGPDEEYA